MQKSETITGRQRLKLSSLLNARRQQSLTKQCILCFDPAVLWRKLQLLITIRSTLGCLHQQIIDEAIHNPSSPFYSRVNENSRTVGINKNHYVFFDPSEYKANRQMRTSLEVKRILTLPPERRSKEEIHFVMISLRGISAIAEYPVRLQWYLAEFGTFESYKPKRVIVKQGRIPEAFYYILYGRVIVTVLNEITGKVDVKCHLHRGQAFGELAIIKDSCRLSSIITKNYTEFLCLSSEVFQKYFMVGGVKNMNDPDQTNFVRSLNFLRGWPVDLILQNANHQNVTFGYFKRGSILTKDSNYSDWLIIVKSGSLKVLMKLTEVHPTVSKKSGLPRTGSDSRHSRYLCFLRDNREYLRYLKQNKIILPPPFGSEERNMESKNKHEMMALSSRPKSTFIRQKSSIQSFKRISSAPGMGRTTSKLIDFKPYDQLLTVKKTTEVMVTSPRFSKDYSLSLDYDDANDCLEFEEKRTFPDSLDSTNKERTHIKTEADFKPQFVLVQTLTKGDVFGLAQCLFCEQPSLCIVSNGADCLLINKKLYLDNCPADLIRRLRIEVSPYPTMEKLQEDLCTRINWDVYKSALFKQLIKKTKVF